MSEKILFVDDEQLVLDAVRRDLGSDFQIDTANSGAAALDLVSIHGPYAVVIADMRMPDMNGIQLLMKVNQACPETVRMILTGNADLQSVIAAINDGQIFRFLTKPCPSEVLQKNIQMGLRQYQLVVSEQELLSKTLVGSIQVLIEILSISNPDGFRRATRLRKLMAYVVNELNLEDGWRYLLAAMLCQVGWISLPPELVSKLINNDYLTKDDQRLFASHPAVTRKLLERIPRMSLIGRMIEGQQMSYSELNMDDLRGDDYVAGYGANLLRTLIDFDSMVAGGMQPEMAIGMMTSRGGTYKKEFLWVLNKLASEQHAQIKVVSLRLEQLETGMVVMEGVWDRNGTLLVPKITEITHQILMRLYSLNERPGTIVEPIKVSVPQ